MHIEQAIYGGHDPGGYRFLARSAGFRDDWLPLAEALCTGFGDRPAGATCPFAVFARPFGRDHVAVVQVADQGQDDAGRPGALAFRLLVVPARLYAGVESDPFLLSDRFPPDWAARGELAVLTWEGGAPPARTVAQLRRVLDVAPPLTASLLGGVQVLIDGGRIAFQRSHPEPDLIRGLWMLLPASSRGEMWPATFAFGNAHGFHVLAVPDNKGPGLERHSDGDEAGGYPEGRYEYAIQKAVEDEDQASVDALLARSTRGQMIRLALFLLAVLVIGVVLMKVPLGVRHEAPEPEKKGEKKASREGGRWASG